MFHFQTWILSLGFLLPICSTSVGLSILLVVAYLSLQYHSSNKILETFSLASQPRKKTQMNKSNGTRGAEILNLKLASCSSRSYDNQI